MLDILKAYNGGVFNSSGHHPEISQVFELFRQFPVKTPLEEPDLEPLVQSTSFQQDKHFEELACNLFS